MRYVLLLALAQSVVTLRPAQSAGRRAALLGAAAAAASSLAPVQPAAAISDILDRAKSNSLTTDRVIFRAMNEQLISPRVIDDCDALESIYKIDLKAAEEMRVSNEAMMKLNAAAVEADRRSLGGRSSDVLKESYEIGRLVEERIRERASTINFKIARECLDR